MNPLKILIVTFGVWLLTATVASAGLVVQVGSPKTTGSKAVVKLDMENTYTSQIQSVRAAIFLLNDQGKVVGQSTSWIIGGGKNKPELAANAKTTYNFILPAGKPFTKAKLMVERILLENGKLANALTDVQIIDSAK
jgi:hypothetical protein